jgi:hypothetical protein
MASSTSKMNPFAEKAAALLLLSPDEHSRQRMLN